VGSVDGTAYAFDLLDAELWRLVYRSMPVTLWSEGTVLCNMYGLNPIY